MNKESGPPNHVSIRQTMYTNRHVEMYHESSSLVGRVKKQTRKRKRLQSQTCRNTKCLCVNKHTVTDQSNEKVGEDITVMKTEIFDD